MEAGKKNQIYSIFRKLNKKEQENCTGAVMWEKRKLSPDQHMPAPKNSRMQCDGDGKVVKVPTSITPLTRDRALSTASQNKNPLKRVQKTARRRSNSLGSAVDWSKQKKITDMLSKKASEFRDHSNMWTPRRLDMEQFLDNEKTTEPQ